MLEFDGLLGLVMTGLWLFCIFDVITSDASDIRNLPKGMWLFLVIILFDIGSIMWLIAGRPRTTGMQPGGMPYKGNRGAAAPRRQPRGKAVAPDDDPEFLAGLKKIDEEHEQLLSQWEADLKRREEELRKRPEDPTA